MSTSDTVEGFDPKHEDAQSPNGGKVKRMYETLKNRGKHDAAEEVRQEKRVREQLRLANQHPEFDPKHDDWQTTTKGEIQRVYNWLLDHGQEDAAESLRGIDTVRQQQDRMSKLKRRYSIPTRGE